MGVKFSDITTIGVGGYIENFFEPETRGQFIEALSKVDLAEPLFLIGSGSNTLASDEKFLGTVIRCSFGSVEILGQEPEGSFLRADAGMIWDDFAMRCSNSGLQGVENLSGIPGTVGSAVVQNIGAYGSEVSEAVVEVEAWDRKAKKIARFDKGAMHFGYRTSLLKEGMRKQGGRAPFPSLRYAVLSVTFFLSSRSSAPIKYGEVAKFLGRPVGSEEALQAIRNAVLSVRGAKNMLEDPSRYKNKRMRALMPKRLDGMDGSRENFDRHSCGSFFTNPIVSPKEAERLPEMPKFKVDGGIKLSAAWLIEHAGYGKGYPLKKNPNARAALSKSHALAITNRGGATSKDVLDLAREVRDGVKAKFGVSLIPEPVLIGLEV